MIDKISKFLRSCPLIAALFALLFARTPALGVNYSVDHTPEPKRYFLMGGPTWIGGEDFGRGAYLGVFNTRSTFATGVAFGGFQGEKLVRHGDFFVGLAPLVMTYFVLGIGVRRIESGALLPQLTHGLSLGPTALMFRRYRGPKGQVIEGLITLNFPLCEFLI